MSCTQHSIQLQTFLLPYPLEMLVHWMFVTYCTCCNNNIRCAMSQLANNTGKEIEQQALEMQLSAKQMEIEILLMMSK